jgi:hypothetical protein
MKIYWWQGGLHVEPESREDTEALMRIWGARRISVASQELDEGSTGVVLEKPLNIIGS